MVWVNSPVDAPRLETIEAIARRIRPVVESDSRVQFVYLYGSLARGDARPGSDVDLAVSLRPSGDLFDEARLHDQLAAALGRDDVDMLIVDTAPLWLQFRVVAGRVLFSRDERARIAFRERVEKFYLDFRPYHDRYLQPSENARAGGCLAMVDRDRVDQLFAMLSRYLRILRDLADISLAEYQADPRNFGSGERFLQLAIETTLSVGHHIIASAGFDQPTTYAEVFRVLGKEGVLDPEFAAMLEPMARMRNRLVYHYEDIEPARMHETLRTHLSDFDLFARSITEYLDRSAQAL